jgi:Leu/Phe-tRNA-protein transferase
VNIQLGIYNLSYENLKDASYLVDVIYPNMLKNYYWSDDFSPEFYIAQAKAGFIAVTDMHEDEELLLPEIQFAYALLDFKNLHISSKVKKVLKNNNIELQINHNFDEVVAKINTAHKNCWLTPRYAEMLKATKGLDESFELMAVSIKDGQTIVAAEIGYSIGKTYTSLSGFTSRDKRYVNYGTTQLVLLAQHLEKSGFSFWNLGHPYMDYKQQLGATIYNRDAFLRRWYLALQ